MAKSKFTRNPKNYNKLDVELLRRLFRYDPETGILYWKPRDDYWSWHWKWNEQYAGKPAGNPTDTGCLMICIKTKPFKVHRIIWAIVTGKPPANEIDHIDGNRMNNRFENLREATSKQNCWNSIGRKSSTSGGIKGVSWYARDKKWRAVIQQHGKTFWLGSFKTIEEAAAVYRAKELELFGDFARR